MLCAVLLTVAAADRARREIEDRGLRVRRRTEPKFRSSSADHTSSLLPGISAAATGISGKPIVGPTGRRPTDLRLRWRQRLLRRQPLGRAGAHRSARSAPPPLRARQPVRPIARSTAPPAPHGASTQPSCRSRSPASGHTPQCARIAFRPATGSPEPTDLPERSARHVCQARYKLSGWKPDCDRLRQPGVPAEASAQPVGRSPRPEHRSGGMAGGGARRRHAPAVRMKRRRERDLGGLRRMHHVPHRAWRDPSHPHRPAGRHRRRRTDDDRRGNRRYDDPHH